MNPTCVACSLSPLRLAQDWRPPKKVVPLRWHWLAQTLRPKQGPQQAQALPFVHWLVQANPGPQDPLRAGQPLSARLNPPPAGRSTTPASLARHCVRQTHCQPQAQPPRSARRLSALVVRSTQRWAADPQVWAGAAERVDRDRLCGRGSAPQERQRADFLQRRCAIE
jgi:hypothetical protein